MSTKLQTVTVNDTLNAVKAILDAHRIHHVPVVDGTKLVGIVTTQDLYKLNKPFADYSEIPVKEVMTSKVATMNPDDKVGSVAEILLENLFHAVPIVDEAHTLLGIVTSFDVIKYEFEKEYPPR